MSVQVYDVFRARLGWVGILGTDRGLSRATLPEDSADDCVESLLAGAPHAVRDRDLFADLRARLVSYFEGDDADFRDVRLDLADAPRFSVEAWEACRSIPRGETRTYSWLATQAGRPNAPRAAGQAMARNRFPIVVPCHRVIGADGSLRGFGSGQTRVDLKRILLDMEMPQGRLV